MFNPQTLAVVKTAMGFLKYKDLISVEQPTIKQKKSVNSARTSASKLCSNNIKQLRHSSQLPVNSSTFCTYKDILLPYGHVLFDFSLNHLHKVGIVYIVKKYEQNPI